MERAPDPICVGCNEPVRSMFVRVQTSRLTWFLYALATVASALPWVLVFLVLGGSSGGRPDRFLSRLLWLVGSAPALFLFALGATRARVRVIACPKCGTTTRIRVPRRWTGLRRIFGGAVEDSLYP